MRFLIIILLLLIAGCGYHTPGSSDSWVGGEGRVVYVQLFKNLTSEPYLENYLADALVSELSRSRALVLTEDKGKTDLNLVGSIDRFEAKALSFRGDDRIADYRTEMAVSVQLVDSKNGRVLWKDKVNAKEDYSAVVDKNIQMEFQRYTARQAADRIAEDIYSHLFNMF